MRVEGGGSSEEHPANAHDGGQRAHVVQTGPAGGWSVPPAVSICLIPRRRVAVHTPSVLHTCFIHDLTLTGLCLNQEEFTPVKYFSIDRVFRNETLDATHLAEFHQIEGVVADYGLTLGDLMGILHQFFTKLGQE